ncbi:MAG: DnaD domain protein [Lachnospiraceae bacterium]|nr:DnaD domain protein [Lachnospiraceae bacterium]
MSKITLHNSNLSATYVSNQFIDHYMTSANGEYVKVYLYLLRCMGSDHCSFSISSAADLFEHTEKDIQRALLYWEKMKLLHLEYDAEKHLSAIQLLTPEEAAASGQAVTPGCDRQPALGSQADAGPAPLTAGIPDAGTSAPLTAGNHLAAGSQAPLTAGIPDAAALEHLAAGIPAAGTSAPLDVGIPAAAAPEHLMSGMPAAAAPEPSAAGSSTVTAPARPGSYTAAQLEEFQKKEEIRELLFVTEHYLKRPLTPTDINTILFWYDELAFPEDLIEYLIEYCVGRSHTSLSYMNKVAISWKDTGITTLERAKHTATAFSRLHFAVVRALGIQGRNLIPSETAMIQRWSKSYGFSLELIEEACRRTIAATHHPNFDYADGILKSWHQQKVHNLSDVSRLDQAFQKNRPSANTRRTAAPNKFNNFSQRSYDYDKLEQQLLSRADTRQEELSCR